MKKIFNTIKNNVAWFLQERQEQFKQLKKKRYVNNVAQTTFLKDSGLKPF